MQVVVLKIDAGHLLVPVSIVAQITSSSDPTPYQGNLPFVRNTIAWRDFRVPVVNSSELCGAPAGADDAFERTVVLWPMQGAGATDMFGLTSQNSPRVVNIPTDSAQAEAPVNSDYVLGAVSVEGGLGIIPDLEKISRNLFG